jgi:hydrogenase maturation factor
MVMIPDSGLAFLSQYAGFDARERFGVKAGKAARTACRCGTRR